MRHQEMVNGRAECRYVLGASPQSETRDFQTQGHPDKDRPGDDAFVGAAGSIARGDALRTRRETTERAEEKKSNRDRNAECDVGRVGERREAGREPGV
jgi:hypothetical protein